MLRIENLSVEFGQLRAVDGVSLEVPAGSVLAVLGPSGCGKSTLLRAIAGLEPLTDGSVCFDGVDLAGVPTHRRAFAMMFQDGQLFAHLDVGANVAYPLARRGIRSGVARAEVSRLLALVGLDGYAARRPATLSGGEAQRVALARALAARPRLLLLDEPLSALDRSLRERLAEDLRRVLAETATTAMLVTHDHDEAYAVADRAAIMRAGRLVQQGPVAQVWAQPADAEVARFLGYDTVLTGAAAARVLAAAGDGTGDWVALRRDAVRLAGQGPLRGAVQSTHRGQDGLRVGVDVEGVGLLVAIGDPEASVGVGEMVALRVDHRRVALIPPSSDRPPAR